MSNFGTQLAILKLPTNLFSNGSFGNSKRTRKGPRIFSGNALQVLPGVNWSSDLHNLHPRTTFLFGRSSIRSLQTSGAVRLNMFVNLLQLMAFNVGQREYIEEIL